METHHYYKHYKYKTHAYSRSWDLRLHDFYKENIAFSLETHHYYKHYKYKTHTYSRSWDLRLIDFYKENIEFSRILLYRFYKEKCFFLK